MCHTKSTVVYKLRFTQEEEGYTSGPALPHAPGTMVG